MSQLHIVVVSYTFPPSTMIGGRRWAKFSKHFVKFNQEVTVVCAENPEDKNWYAKNFQEVDVQLLDDKYPTWLSGNCSSIFEKIKYSIATKFRMKIIKENLFDKAYNCENELLGLLSKIHSTKKIDALVVTGAPYSLLYYGAKFKSLNQEVKLVSDLRDPWTWTDYYGFKDLTSKQIDWQEYMEKYTMEQSDVFCCTTDHMLNVLKTKYSHLGQKLYLLPHAFDEEKFTGLTESSEREGFIYGGSLYPGIQEILKDISTAVSDFTKEEFFWDIYTNAKDRDTLDLLPQGKSKVNAYIPEEELFQKIKNSKAYLVVFPTTDKDILSTKFFEIVYIGTPIIYIGDEGEVSNFISKYELGVHILPENVIKELPSYIKNEVPFRTDLFDVSEYSFSKVTSRLLDHIGQIT